MTKVTDEPVAPTAQDELDHLMERCDPYKAMVDGVTMEELIRRANDLPGKDFGNEVTNMLILAELRQIRVLLSKIEAKSEK